MIRRDGGKGEPGSLLLVTATSNVARSSDLVDTGVDTWLRMVTSGHRSSEGAHLLETGMETGNQVRSSRIGGCEP